MAWDARVDGRHHAAPLIAGLVEVGVADTAEKDFDLYVVFGWLSPCNGGSGKRRCRTSGGVSLGVGHGFVLLTFLEV
jgi:hypothetical protein